MNRISTPPSHVPVSTYRVQMHRDFTFDAAARIIPYLADLGIGDLYCSPYLLARAGSRHGYDIADHTRLNPEVGSEEDYARFTRTIHANGLRQLLDFVPNHMGIDPRTNRWWRDVLENGPSSIYGRFFDIDWRPVKAELHGKVLLPILGDQYGMVLERGELRLAFDGGALHLTYFDHDLPIDPRRATAVYEHNLDALKAEMSDEDADLREFLSVLTELKNLPDHLVTDPERIAERHREKEMARERLTRLTARSPRIRRHIEEAIAVYNGEPGRPATFDLLHVLLEGQAYRLAYWRTASHEINYRRFFDINDLAGLRMEDAEVFAATHVLVARLIGDGSVSGLRIDHPDGLYDPRQYFRRLQHLAGEQIGRLADETDPAPLYLVAEKILSGNEHLAPDWPVDGTTGYNLLNDLNGLFVDPSAVRPLRSFYRRITRQLATFDEVVYQCKKLITRTSLASELNVLAHALNQLSEGDRRSRDFTLNSLRDALGEVVACFPVYRTYVNTDGWAASDRSIIETAVRRARRRNPVLEATAWDFLREVLLPRRTDTGPDSQAVAREADTTVERRANYPSPDPEEYQRRLHFTMHFQQYTAPVQAKGVEDTAFYRYNLLVSLNEVGGDPGRFGRNPAEFHAANQARLERYPFEMTATATHDTKLGEDVRARINVLSELVDDWRRGVSRWMRINAANRTKLETEMAPDRNDEYRLYQVLVGTWPMVGPGMKAVGPENESTEWMPDEEYVRRIRDYMTKATKEAKVKTSWINDNQAYDTAMSRFVERTLAGPTTPRFVAAFAPFAMKIAQRGMVNSLAQLVLKVASPGVPDFYQGNELWDLHLVDPDNRQPVDFELRRRLLEQILPALDHVGADAVRDMLACWPDGRIKLFVTAAALRLRRADPQLFLEGEYTPLAASVTVVGDVVAFMRRTADAALIAIVPRLVARLTNGTLPVGEAWSDSRIDIPRELAGDYRNAFTGEMVSAREDNGTAGILLADALRTCPVAMLVKKG